MICYNIITQRTVSFIDEDKNQKTHQQQNKTTQCYYNSCNNCNGYVRFILLAYEHAYITYACCFYVYCRYVDRYSILHGHMDSQRRRKTQKAPTAFLRGIVSMHQVLQQALF